ncbi:hypothetical protein CEXT_161891 [Caerostris extrusa]|uniref:Uncharacterized protein n=1 Tax=Caerostris extrusa TaxID=172846 RepID=A0AAV4VVG1_CAEEX|nr:hypothetical protein CEXT_161891 [Caerostris extrusa]
MLFFLFHSCLNARDDAAKTRMSFILRKLNFRLPYFPPPPSFFCRRHFSTPSIFFLRAELSSSQPAGNIFLLKTPPFSNRPSVKPIEKYLDHLFPICDYFPSRDLMAKETFILPHPPHVSDPPFCFVLRKQQPLDLLWRYREKKECRR